MHQSLIELVPWTFVMQILNLLLQAWLFKKFLFQPVKRIIEKRKSEVDGLYSEAERAKTHAAESEAKTSAALAQADAKAGAILADAENAAKQTGAEILASARAEAAAMKDRAAQDIELEKKRAVNGMKNELSALAVELAAKVTEQEISEEKHEALISDFIDRLGDRV